MFIYILDLSRLLFNRLFRSNSDTKIQTPTHLASSTTFRVLRMDQLASSAARAQNDAQKQIALLCSRRFQPHTHTDPPMPVSQTDLSALKAAADASAMKADRIEAELLEMRKQTDSHKLLNYMPSLVPFERTRPEHLDAEFISEIHEERGQFCMPIGFSILHQP